MFMYMNLQKDSHAVPGETSRRSSVSLMDEPPGDKSFHGNSFPEQVTSKKSDRDEFMLYLKLVSLGVLIIGMIGFLIKFISAAFPGYSDRSRGPLLSDHAY